MLDGHIWLCLLHRIREDTKHFYQWSSMGQHWWDFSTIIMVCHIITTVLVFIWYDSIQELERDSLKIHFPEIIMDLGI